MRALQTLGLSLPLLATAFQAQAGTALETSRAMARELEAKLPQDRVEARVPLADWMWAKGLHAEALAQLDKVLGADPDQRNARELLAKWDASVLVLGARGRDAIADDVRAQPAAYLKQACALPPAARELALARVAAVAAPDALREAARAALVDRSPQLRATAAHVLRRAAPAAELRALVDRLVLDRDALVRTEAARTLVAAGEPDVVQPVLRALGSKHEAVRGNAAEALGMLGAFGLANAASAVEPLVAALAAPPVASAGAGIPSSGSLYVGRQVAYIRDYDVQIAQSASIADPIIDVMHEAVQLDAKVLGVTEMKVSVSVSSRICRALAKLTAQPLGDDPAAWLAWWSANGAAWKAAHPSASTAPNTTGPRTGA
ncbi:MAG: HEAT repeat domain-containing protein [Planctomycetota bacterium]|nr:MAG: HEAT repeat domain-containing protein [Planctomycetota bacterium]